MSSISRTDVNKLAALSALSLSDEQIVGLQKDLDTILDYIDQLQDVDTSDVEPTYAVHGLENVFRADEIIDYGVSEHDLLKNAPQQRGGSIVVPRVLE